MYTKICIPDDTVNERYLLGAELVGRYDFPQLKPINADVDGLKPVAFPSAKSERKPRECIAHFFVADKTFERVWNNVTKYMEYLQYFRYVCSPDYSMYSDMPLTLQIWNTYRNRVLAYCMQDFGIKVIPTVGWSNQKSFDFCFDGLPKGSTLAVSTNGCFTSSGKENYRAGFTEMCKRLDPTQVIVVGKEIEVDVDVKIKYLESFGQQMTKRLKGV